MIPTTLAPHARCARSDCSGGSQTTCHVPSPPSSAAHTTRVTPTASTPGLSGVSPACSPRSCRRTRGWPRHPAPPAPSDSPVASRFRRTEARTRNSGAGIVLPGPPSQMLLARRAGRHSASHERIPGARDRARTHGAGLIHSSVCHRNSNRRELRGTAPVMARVFVRPNARPTTWLKPKITASTVTEQDMTFGFRTVRAWGTACGAVCLRHGKVITVAQADRQAVGVEAHCRCGCPRASRRSG